MFCYRITKYNPARRNLQGHYTKNEWTSFSDIGKLFENNRLTYEQYLLIENNYIKAIREFMSCTNRHSLTITSLEKYNNFTDAPYYTSDLIEAYNSITEGPVTEKEIINITRLALRENIWCKLESEEVYVHFGHDYYMYIGCSRSCPAAIEKVTDSGLFIEAFKSPYGNQK